MFGYCSVFNIFSNILHIKKKLACYKNLILNATSDTEKGCLVNVDRCTDAIYKRDVTYPLANHVTIVNISRQKQRTRPSSFPCIGSAMRIACRFIRQITMMQKSGKSMGNNFSFHVHGHVHIFTRCIKQPLIFDLFSRNAYSICHSDLSLN